VKLRVNVNIDWVKIGHITAAGSGWHICTMLKTRSAKGIQSDLHLLTCTF